LSDLSLTPRLTPHGHLVLSRAEDTPPLDPQLASRLRDAFDRGAGHGLLRLGAGEVGQLLPPALSYFRELGGRYVTALCTRPDAATTLAALPPPADDELAALALAAPAMPGAEYLTTDVLRALWAAIDCALSAELAESGATVQELLQRLHPAWNVVGRVHFNLAENRKDEEAPFAFLATYTSRLSAHGKAQHQPLGQALRELAGATRKPELLSLLVPVQRASQRCAWLRRMVDAGEIFHPLRWTAGDAFRLLGDVPALEAAGVVVRMPAVWKASRPPRPRVTATVGTKTPSGLGTGALLDFQMDVTLDEGLSELFGLDLATADEPAPAQPPRAAKGARGKQGAKQAPAARTRTPAHREAAPAAAPTRGPRRKMSPPSRAKSAPRKTTTKR
jgi:non-specific serine/threonine protein kinase